MSKIIKQQTISTTTRRHAKRFVIEQAIGGGVTVEFGFVLQKTDDATGDVLEENEVMNKVTGAEFNSEMTYPIANGAQLLSALSTAAMAVRDAHEAANPEP